MAAVVARLGAREIAVQVHIRRTRQVPGGKGAFASAKAKSPTPPRRLCASIAVTRNGREPSVALTMLVSVDFGPTSRKVRAPAA